MLGCTPDLLLYLTGKYCRFAILNTAAVCLGRKRCSTQGSGGQKLGRKCCSSKAYCFSVETRPEGKVAGSAAGNTDCFSVETRRKWGLLLGRKEAQPAPRPEAWPETLTVPRPEAWPEAPTVSFWKRGLSHTSLGIGCWATTCEMAAVKNCWNLGIIFKYLKMDIICPEFYTAFAIYFSCLGFESSSQWVVLECEYYITELYSFFFWLL